MGITVVVDDQVCPKCGYVLIDLAEYDAHENIAGTAVMGDAHGLAEEGLLSGAHKWIIASAKQKKLNAILSQYPSSLYCAQCGYLLKRS